MQAATAMGWIGTVGTIGAYVMLSRGRWNAGSIRYGVLNMLGGLLCATGSASYGAWPSVASNLIWSAVALQSILVSLRERRVAAAPGGALPQLTAVDEPVVETKREEPVSSSWPDTLTMPAVVGVA